MRYRDLIKSKLIENNHDSCICISGKYYTYSEIAKNLADIDRGLHDCHVVAITTTKEISTYILIIYCAVTGKTFVPITSDQPVDRIKYILETSEADVFLVSPSDSINIESEKMYLKECASNLSLEGIKEKTGKIKDLAYILFTSGSTGTPKGVCISQANLNSYILNFTNDITITSSDRVSQFFDLTFDVSIHDILVTLYSGACMYVLSEGDRLFLHKFINENEITVWFSVPSYLNAYLDRIHKKIDLPSLRVSIFAGEPLSGEFLKKWSAIALKSKIYNLYGPTETTIGICWTEVTHEDIDNGEIPIGLPSNGHEYYLDGEAEESVGELCILGPQVGNGYLEVTMPNNGFFYSAGHDAGFRTGDIVRKKDETLYFVCRNDSQVKVRGIRIELGDIEENIKAATGILDVYACHANVDGRDVLIVLTNSSENVENIKKNLSSLPSYMEPDKILQLDSIPRTKSGKVDRKALRISSLDAIKSKPKGELHYE